MYQPHGITTENLLRTLPDVLKQDNAMQALGTAVADALAVLPDEINVLRIYNRIDELPENLLDILAHDFKVDWWDPNYTLDEKRRVFKDNWAVHRKLGTKYALQMAVSAIFPDTVVQEWFEYGGKPHYFRILSNSPRVAQEDLERFMFIVMLVKRNSQWLEEILVSMPWHMNLYVGIACHETSKDIQWIGGI